MISITVQHAFRALSCLAHRDPAELVPGRELAREADVPLSYLSKILKTLGRAGLVDAARGLHGGYRLAQPACEIRLESILAALEPEALDPVCFLHAQHQCSNQSACPVHARWKKVRETYTTFLREATLEELSPTLELELRR